jgi:hypothetical protein
MGCSEYTLKLAILEGNMMINQWMDGCFMGFPIIMGMTGLSG